MEPIQALQILDNIAAQVALNRKDRTTADQATAALHQFIKAHTKPATAIPPTAPPKPTIVKKSHAQILKAAKK